MDDQRTRSRPGSVAELAVGHQGGPGPSEKDRRRHRIDEYAYPLEDARAQAAYGMRGGVSKVLVVNREIIPGRLTVVLVDEVLGF